MPAAIDELTLTMTERELAKNVVHAAKTLGWRVYWTWNSLHSPRGWPDLVLLRGIDRGDPDLDWLWDLRGYPKTAIIFAELKREKGKLTPDQEETLELLRGIDRPVYVWRPSNWLSGEIAEILARNW